MPNYLVDYLHLSSKQMGFVMSAIGFGGFAGQFMLPALSDFLGRRTVTVFGFLGGALSVYAFAHHGRESGDVVRDSLPGGGDEPGLARATEDCRKPDHSRTVANGRYSRSSV